MHRPDRGRSNLRLMTCRPRSAFCGCRWSLGYFPADSHSGRILLRIGS